MATQAQEAEPNKSTEKEKDTATIAKPPISAPTKSSNNNKTLSVLGEEGTSTKNSTVATRMTKKFLPTSAHHNHNVRSSSLSLTTTTNVTNVKPPLMPIQQQQKQLPTQMSRAATQQQQQQHHTMILPPSSIRKKSKQTAASKKQKVNVRQPQDQKQGEQSTNDEDDEIIGTVKCTPQSDKESIAKEARAYALGYLRRPYQRRKKKNSTLGLVSPSASATPLKTVPGAGSVAGPMTRMTTPGSKPNNHLPPPPHYHHPHYAQHGHPPHAQFMSPVPHPQMIYPPLPPPPAHAVPPPSSLDNNNKTNSSAEQNNKKTQKNSSNTSENQNQAQVQSQNQSQVQGQSQTSSMPQHMPAQYYPYPPPHPPHHSSPYVSYPYPPHHAAAIHGHHPSTVPQHAVPSTQQHNIHTTPNPSPMVAAQQQRSGKKPSVRKKSKPRATTSSASKKSPIPTLLSHHTPTPSTPGMLSIQQQQQQFTSFTPEQIAQNAFLASLDDENDPENGEYHKFMISLFDFPGGIDSTSIFSFNNKNNEGDDEEDEASYQLPDNEDCEEEDDDDDELLATEGEDDEEESSNVPEMIFDPEVASALSINSTTQQQQQQQKQLSSPRANTNTSKSLPKKKQKRVKMSSQETNTSSSNKNDNIITSTNSKYYFEDELDELMEEDIEATLSTFLQQTLSTNNKLSTGANNSSSPLQSQLTSFINNQDYQQHNASSVSASQQAHHSLSSSANNNNNNKTPIAASAATAKFMSPPSSVVNDKGTLIEFPSNFPQTIPTFNSPALQKKQKVVQAASSILLGIDEFTPTTTNIFDHTHSHPTNRKTNNNNSNISMAEKRVSFTSSSLPATGENENNSSISNHHNTSDSCLSELDDNMITSSDETVTLKHMTDLHSFMLKHHQLLIQQLVLSKRFCVSLKQQREEHMKQKAKMKKMNHSSFSGGGSSSARFPIQESTDDFVDFMNTASDMLRDLDRNRKDAIRNAIYLSEESDDVVDSTPSSSSANNNCENDTTPSANVPINGTITDSDVFLSSSSFSPAEKLGDINEIDMNSNISSSKGVSPHHNNNRNQQVQEGNRRLTRAAFAKTLLERESSHNYQIRNNDNSNSTGGESNNHNGSSSRNEKNSTEKQEIKNHIHQTISIFDVKGLNKLDKLISTLKDDENNGEGDNSDGNSDNTSNHQLYSSSYKHQDACRTILQEMGSQIDMTILPREGVPLSSLLMFSHEYARHDFLNTTSPEQQRQVRMNRTIFTQHEDNLLLRGVNLFGEKEWNSISDRFLPEHSTSAISQRYSRLCFFLYQKNNIVFDSETGDLETPPDHLNGPQDFDENLIMSKLKPVEEPLKHNVHRWSLDEDICILKAVPIMGRMWAEISQRLMPHRDRGHIRKRYQVLERRIKGALRRDKKMTFGSASSSSSSSSNNNNNINNMVMNTPTRKMLRNPPLSAGNITNNSTSNLLFSPGGGDALENFVQEKAELSMPPLPDSQNKMIRSPTANNSEYYGNDGCGFSMMSSHLKKLIGSGGNSSIMLNSPSQPQQHHHHQHSSQVLHPHANITIAPHPNPLSTPNTHDLEKLPNILTFDGASASGFSIFTIGDHNNNNTGKSPSDNNAHKNDDRIDVNNNNKQSPSNSTKNDATTAAGSFLRPKKSLMASAIPNHNMSQIQNKNEKLPPLLSPAATTSKATNINTINNITGSSPPVVERMDVIGDTATQMITGEISLGGLSDLGMSNFRIPGDTKSPPLKVDEAHEVQGDRREASNIRDREENSNNIFEVADVLHSLSGSSSRLQPQQQQQQHNQAPPHASNGTTMSTEDDKKRNLSQLSTASSTSSISGDTNNDGKKKSLFSKVLRLSEPKSKKRRTT